MASAKTGKKVVLKSKHMLLNYCKTVLSDIHTKKREFPDDNQKESILTVYEEKCFHLIYEIENLKEKSSSFVVLSDILQKIAQLLLDLTYIDECCLVDHDFQLQSAHERVTKIIATLSGLEKLAREAFRTSPKDALGPSITECIHWRKGALLYMYCHTLNARIDKVPLPSHFKQCLEAGCKHLVAMLSTRDAPVWLRDPLTSPPGGTSGATDSTGDDGDMLFSQGIYSDTHLLALMYLGEMCYWHAQVTNQSQPLMSSPSVQSSTVQRMTVNKPISEGSSSTSPLPAGQGQFGDRSVARHERNKVSVGETVTETNRVGQASTGSKVNTEDEGLPCMDQGDSALDLLKTGQLCLESYVKAAKGPMSAGGWSTGRAEEILQYFETLSL